ncbi:MAG: hypothetical protein K0U52_13490, partial [Gammaproteobacteria bacterium]|nr:hypothetical protein [Gammaproteobacteria bacterium]
NGINMWNAGTRVRNNDFNDARQLIGNAVNMFAKVKMKEGMRNPVLNTNLATVTDFLTSPDHSFVSPFKFRGKDVKEAVKALTEELRKDDGAYSHLPKMQRENIALSLQAAVELKCTVHETWLGSAQRNIDNFTRRIPLLGPVLRVVMAVAATPGAMAEWAQHGNDRREMHKASYEGILAESLGSLKGGCMSSADRAGEVAEQRAAMKKQFAEEGKILSYNDSADEKKRVYSKYGSTKAKHDFVEIATGTPGTSDGETRGKAFNARAGVLSHVAETPEEQKLAKDLSGLRKGKYKAVTTEAYLVSQPVGGVVRNASQVAPEPQGVRSPSTSVSTATRSVSTAVPVNNTQPPGPALTKEALKNVTEQREVVPPKKPEDPDVVLTSTHGM